LTAGSRVRGVRLQVGTTLREEAADAVVLATGHLVSGGLLADRERLVEPIFDAPVSGPTEPPYFNEAFLASSGHPVLSTGVEVDERLRPAAAGRPVVDNLFACGDILAGFDPYRERSGGGVALATGGCAGRFAAEVAA
jgi:glycerol-3-phosphate dehydrogenase subunit B